MLFSMVIDRPPEIWLFALYKVAASYWRRGNRNRLLEQLIHHNMIYLTCGLGESPSSSCREVRWYLWPTVFSLGVILTTARLNVSARKSDETTYIDDKQI